MAVPAYTHDLVDWIADSDTTAWGELTNAIAGGSPDEADTESALQGTNSTSQSMNTTNLCSMCRILGSSVTLSTNDVFLVWHGHGVATALLSYASGGLRLAVATTLTDWKAWAVGGNDVPPFPYTKWVNNPVDPTITGEYTNGTPPAALTFFGVGSMAQLSQAVAKGQPHIVDMIRYGRARARFSGGESANYGTFSGFATLNDASSARWGLIQSTSGGYLWKGLMNLGFSTVATTNRARTSNVATLTTGSAHGFRVGDTLTMTGIGGTGYNVTATVASVPTTTTFTYANTGSNEGSTADTGGSINGIVDFRDSNKTILIQDTRKVYSAFNKVEIRNSSSRVDWTGITFNCLSPSTTASKGALEVVDAADVNIDSCTFIDMDTFIFTASSAAINSTFRRTNTVTAPGTDLTGSIFDAPTVTANTSAVVWNVATDPDGLLDDTTFSMGTNSHHAIEFGTSSPTTMTIRGITFTGFSSSNNVNNSVLHIKRTTGTVTIYTVSCSGTVSYRSEGADVEIIADPVTVLVNVKNSSGTNIQDARVFIKTSDNTGPFPFEETVSGIVNSGTTATVTHTSHGMDTNDKVIIEGASHDANNGVFSITRTSDDVYTYTMGSSPGSSPTGTIKSTFVAIYGLTDSNGNISMSRVFPADQPITGWARKSSAAPFYKTGPIGGSVDSSSGFTANVQLILDQ
jgi:hypothetical protein